MYFSKIRINGFGKLNNSIISLSKGFNVVYGANESGKSTLHGFLKAILYGLESGRTNRDGLMPPAKRFIPWQGGEFGGFVEYVLDNGEIFRVSRNFNTGSVNVYDSSFNDITGEFMAADSRDFEIGAGHLGLNAECFEKTIYISQMETRIGRRDSGEIIGRLVNASLTGYEDVFLNRALSGLKESIKEYAGTGKTTTKPLDRLSRRLAEVEASIDIAVSKRDSVLENENRLKYAAAEKSRLGVKRDIADRSAGIIELLSLVNFYKKRGRELTEIKERLEKLQSDYEKNANILNSLREQKNSFASFGDYGQEDANDAGIYFEKITVLREDISDLEAKYRQSELKKPLAEAHLEACSAYASLEENADFRVEKLVRELNHLKNAKENDNRSQTRYIENIRFRKKILGINATGMLILSLGLIAGGIAGSGFMAYAGILALAAAAVLYFFRLKTGRQLKQLIIYKRNYNLNTRRINGNTKEIQAELKSIYTQAEIDSYEGFLKLKNRYQICTENYNRLEAEMEYLKGCILSKKTQADELAGKLFDMLNKTGIVSSRSVRIAHEHIKSFRTGIIRYCGIDHDICYHLKSEEGTREEMDNLFKRISLILERKCEELGQLAAEIEKVFSNSKKLTGSIELEMYELKKLVESADADGSEMDIYLRLESGEIEAAKSLLKEYRPILEERSNNLEREIAACETIVKNVPGEDFLQRLVEERASLLERKVQLEDLAFSLQTAFDELNKAALEIKKNFSPALNSRMGQIIKKITAGRYSDIRADDSLLLKANIPENTGVLPVLNLSSGTVDQMYLALRLALSELLAHKEILPVIFDEAFAQYDEKRLYETLDFLKDFSSKRQVILFTCRKREVDIACSICGQDQLNLISQWNEPEGLAR